MCKKQENKKQIEMGVVPKKPVSEVSQKKPQTKPEIFSYKFGNIDDLPEDESVNKKEK